MPFVVTLAGPCDPDPVECSRLHGDLPVSCFDLNIFHTYVMFICVFDGCRYTKSIKYPNAIFVPLICAYCWKRFFSSFFSRQDRLKNAYTVRFSFGSTRVSPCCTRSAVTIYTAAGVFVRLYTIITIFTRWSCLCPRAREIISREVEEGFPRRGAAAVVPAATSRRVCSI